MQRLDLRAWGEPVKLTRSCPSLRTDELWDSFSTEQLQHPQTKYPLLLQIKQGGNVLLYSYHVQSDLFMTSKWVSVRFIFYGGWLQMVTDTREITGALGAWHYTLKCHCTGSWVYLRYHTCRRQPFHSHSLEMQIYSSSPAEEDHTTI